MLANPASIHNLAGHFPCYLHGGQGKESNRVRFNESRLKLREAAHRCASLGPRLEECTGTNKKL